jgi:hypothetical protein
MDAPNYAHRCPECPMSENDPYPSELADSVPPKHGQKMLHEERHDGASPNLADGPNQVPELLLTVL